MAAEQPAPHQEPSLSLERLRLTLEVALFCGSLSLLEISKLAPGAVLHLPSRPDDLLRVCIGRIEVGVGRLEEGEGPRRARFIHLGRHKED
jgi:flagellar motor switch protein FliM